MPPTPSWALRPTTPDLFLSRTPSHHTLFSPEAASRRTATFTSPGAVDLGNSQAGGFISVTGQSIVFNAIDAGTTVGLNATGTAPGAEGILGNSITAGGDVNLFGNTIRINDGVTTSASLFASSSGGNARL